MMVGNVSIFWDYELQKGADIVDQQWGVEDYNQTEWLLDILNENNIKCCFAVLGYAAEKGDLPYHAPDQIKRMVKEGHKIASHSYTHKELVKLNDEKILWELEKSKDVLERLIKKDVSMFVPPRNKPFNFFNISVDGDKKPIPWIKPSNLKIDKLCELLDKSGYKNCRLYNIHNKLIKRYVASDIKKINNIGCIYSNIGNGFGGAAKKCVLDAIKTNRTAVIYSHPHELINKRIREDFLEFIKFINSRGSEVSFI